MTDEKDPIGQALDGVKSRYYKVLKAKAAAIKVGSAVNDELEAFKASYDAAVSEQEALRAVADAAVTDAEFELERFTTEQEEEHGISLRLGERVGGGQVIV